MVDQPMGGKPFGWLLWAAFAVIIGGFLLVVAALILSVVGWILYAVVMAVAEANPLSGALFSAAVAVLLIAAFALWREDRWLAAVEAPRDLWRRWERRKRFAIGTSAVLGVAWLVTIPGFWNFLDSGSGVDWRGGRECVAGYSRCLSPEASDYDCAGGSGDGPRYVSGPLRVTGTDVFGLDRDGDGVACDAS